jgi:hypothetical protein
MVFVFDLRTIYLTDDGALVEDVHEVGARIVDLHDFLHLEQRVERKDLRLVSVNHPYLIEYCSKG